MNDVQDLPNGTIYLKTGAHELTHRPVVAIGDVFRVEGADKRLAAEVKALVLYRFPVETAPKSQKKHVVVFSVLKVIERIHEAHPDVAVVCLGAADVIIEYVPAKHPAKWAGRLKLSGVCIITFFGAAFTIMAFNNDISVSGVFAVFYMQVLGTEKPPVTEIEVCYSLGLAVGITLFFNHIGKKQITADPTPIQVELRKYEADVADTLIENASRKGHCEDVD